MSAESRTPSVRNAEIRRRLAANFTPRPEDVEWLLHYADAGWEQAREQADLNVEAGEVISELRQELERIAADPARALSLRERGMVAKGSKICK